jgi:hypothetical protein
MRAARVRLAVAVALFLAWVGWLGFLAATDARPPVVSDPQLLAAAAEVVAHVEAGPDGQLPRSVTVKQVLRGNGLAVGQTIVVANLPDSAGYAGPGDYLIPLAPGEAGAYRIPGPARSPGSELSKVPLRALIYPWNDAVRAQHKDQSGW